MLRGRTFARILIIGLGICLPGLIQAATLIVGPGQDHATIQAAVDAASPLDLIIVRDGTYVENVVINKRISLRAWSFVDGGQNDGAIIDASGSDIEPGIVVTADLVLIDGFTIVGAVGIDGMGYSRSGIKLQAVSGCTVSHNNLGWDEEGFRNSVGLLLVESQSCTVADNEMYNSVCGFEIHHGTSNIFQGNHLEGAQYNTSSSAILLVGTLTGEGYGSTTQHNVITDNELINNYVGVYLNGHCSYNRIEDNTVTSNQIGVAVSYSYFTHITRNNISGNAGRGIWQNATYYSTISNNTIDSNSNGIWLGYLSGSDYGSSNNNIVGNIIINSSYAGLRISNLSLDNRMSLNHFAGNNLNVVSYGTEWNTVTPVSYFFGDNWNGQLGNYYDTYTGTDLDGDGIGDTDLPFDDGDPETGPVENYPLVSPPTEFVIQAWYLGAGDPLTMFDDNDFQPAGSLEIPGLESVVWVSDQTAVWDVDFAEGVWTGQITFGAPPFFDGFTVEVGSSSDGVDFTPSGVQASVGVEQVNTFTTTAAAVSVPAGHHLALRLTNTTGYPYSVQTGGLDSFVSSPGLNDPVWPFGSAGSPVPDLAGWRHHLGGNYPNPFNPSTVIWFDLFESEKVNLRIYDVGGNLVRTLCEDEMMPAGRRQVAWDGKDAAGRKMAAGVYFYRLEVPNFSASRPMVLLK